MNIIEIQEVTKIYSGGFRKGNVVALDRVTLGVRQGEILALVGPNGAGKTTLVKVLLGLVASTSGTVFINGLPPDDARSRVRVGYLQENPRFPQHLTGLGLLETAGRLAGLPSDQVEADAERLLPLVDMEKWSNVKVRKYSKGMIQRIGLAQALLGDPDLIILDEPTDGVDPVGRVEIRNLIAGLRSSGKTVLVNSHLLAEVEAVADRVAILHKGQILRVESVADLTRKQSQFEIRAMIGERTIDIPEDIGVRTLIAADRIVVTLRRDEDINKVIDLLRGRGIDIRAVVPLKVTLEQSFLETISPQQPADSADVVAP